MVLETAQHYYPGFNENYANFGSSVPLVQVITAAENNLRPEVKKTDIKKEEIELSFTSLLPTLMAEVTLTKYLKTCLELWFLTVIRTLKITTMGLENMFKN